MTQPVRVLATKVDSLNSIPVTMWWKERPDSCRFSCALTDVLWHAPSHTNAQKLNMIKNEFLKRIVDQCSFRK